MRLKQRTVLTTTLILLGIAASSFWIVYAAPPHQDGDHGGGHTPAQCDHEDMVQNVMTYVEYLTNFGEEFDANMDTAIARLYEIGESLQTMALDCGHPPPQTEDGHDMDMEDADEHDEGDGHTEEEHSEAIEHAMTIGDAERGQELFNTIIPETGNFACATCHYVDRDDRLVGPGLLSTGRLDHDPSAHNMEEMGDMSDDEAVDDSTTGGGHGGHMDATEEPMMDHDMATDNDPGVQVVEYIRTSILEPNAFIVSGFPENLMPQIYGEVFSNQDIDDIVAYILSLSR